MKHLILTAVVAAIAILLLAPVLARAQACYGNITWQKVYNGFPNLVPPAVISVSGHHLHRRRDSTVVISLAPSIARADHPAVQPGRAGQYSTSRATTRASSARSTGTRFRATPTSMIRSPARSSTRTATA